MLSMYETLKIRSAQIQSGRHREPSGDFISETPVPCGCCGDIAQPEEAIGLNSIKCGFDPRYLYLLTGESIETERTRLDT